MSKIKMTLRTALEDRVEGHGWNIQFRNDLKRHAGKTITLRNYSKSYDAIECQDMHRFNLFSKDGLDWHHHGEWYVSGMTDKQFKGLFVTEAENLLPEDLFEL